MTPVQITDGFGLYAHATQAIQPHHAAHHWSIGILFDYDKRAFIHFVRWQTGPQYRHQFVSMGALCLNGQFNGAPALSNHLDVQWLPQRDELSGYSLPRSWFHRWESSGMMAEM
jgi:hypothetical protein